MATSCSLNFDKLLNLAADKSGFKNELAKLTSNPTVDERLALMDFMHEHTSLTAQKDRYVFGAAEMSRVSKSAEDVYKKYTEEHEDRLTLRDTEIQMDAGTQLHTVAAIIGQEFYEHVKSGSKDSYTPSIKAITRKINQEGTVKIPESAVRVMANTAITMVQLGFDTQAAIDPTKMPDMRFEHRVINPIKGIGGTGDLFIFYSDGTASYIDYKTFEPPAKAKVWDKDTNAFTAVGAMPYQNYRRQKWETTIPAYVSILKDTLKIKGVRHALAVPIATYFKKTDEYQNATKKKDSLRLERLQAEGKTKEREIAQIESIMSNEELVPALVMPATIAENIEMTTFIEERFKQLTEMRRQLSTMRAGAEKDKLMHRIEALQVVIDKIILMDDVSNLVSYVHDIVVEARTLLGEIKKKPSIAVDRWEDIRHLVKELNYYADLSVLTSSYLHRRRLNANIKAELDEMDATEKMLGDINRQLGSFSSSLNAINVSIMQTKGLIDSTITEEEIAKKQIGFEADDILQHWFKGASSSNNPFLNKMKQRHSEIERQIRKQLEAFMKNAEEHFNLLEEFKAQKGWDEKTFIDFMVNPKTGNLVGKFDQQMFTIINEARGKGDYTFFINNYDVRDNYQVSYDRRLGVQKEKLAVKYDVKTEDGKRKYELALNGWIEENALYIHGAINPKAWLKKYNINAFLKRKESFESNYYSEKYQFMINNPKLRKWYDFWTSTMFEAKEKLGHEADISSTLIPWIRKESIELAFERKGNMMTDLLDSLSVGYDGVMEEYDEFGNPDKRIPIMYTQPFKKQGQYDIDAKSMDLQRSMVLFMKMIYNYEYKKQSEIEIMAIRDMMADYGYVYQTSTQGNVLKDISGRLKLTNKNMNEMLETYDAYVDAYWYGNRMQTRDKTTEVFGREISRNKTALLLKRLFGKKVLAWSIHAPLANLIVGKMGSSVTAKKGMIFNEDEYSKANRIWAASKVSLFGLASADVKKFKAFLTYFDPFNDDAIAKRTDAMRSSKLDKYLGDRSQFAMFSWSDEGVIDSIALATAMHYKVSDGILRHPDNAKPTDKSLWELFQMKENGEDISMAMPGLTEEQIDNIWIAYRNIVREAQRSIIGSISDEEIALASTNLLMNLTMQFRTWLPNVAHEMFKGLKYDRTFDAVDIGRMTAFADTFKGLEPKSGIGKHLGVMLGTTAQLIAEVSFVGRYFYPESWGGLWNKERAKMVYEEWAFKHPQLSKNVTFEQYMEARKRQLTALISQLRILAMLTILFMIAGTDWDDDDIPDHRKNFLTRHGFRIINRVYTEFASMFNPQELNKLLSGGPIPTWSLFTSMAKLFTNGLDEIRDSALGENSKRDTTPFFYYTMDFIPLVDRIRKIFELSEADYRATR